MTNLIEQARAKAVKGPGLKSPGIVLLQFLFILVCESIEYAIGKIGIITGIALIISSIAGFILGRAGTSLTNAINPPISFFLSTLAVLTLFGGGFHLSQVGLDLISAMASVAPFLIVSAVIGWLNYFIKRRN